MFSNSRYFFFLKAARWILALLLIVALLDGARQVKLGYRSLLNQGLILPNAEQVVHYPLLGHIGNACFYEPEACEGEFDFFGHFDTGWTLDLKNTGYLRVPIWFRTAQGSFSISFGVRTSQFVGKGPKPLFVVFGKNRAEQMTIHWDPTASQLVVRSLHQAANLSVAWPKEQFAQVTITIDRTRTALFVNGEKQAETTVVADFRYPEREGLQLGGPASRMHFNNVFLFSRALSDHEVQQLSEQLAEYRQWFPLLAVGYYLVLLCGVILLLDWCRHRLQDFGRFCIVGTLAWMRDIDSALEQGGQQ